MHKNLRLPFLFTVFVFSASMLFAQGNKKPAELLFGVAYYDEYMPYERLDKDIQMMKDANINVVRIAESTWSTEEPQDGVLQFFAYRPGAECYA